MYWNYIKYGIKSFKVIYNFFDGYSENINNYYFNVFDNNSNKIMMKKPFYHIQYEITNFKVYKYFISLL